MFPRLVFAFLLLNCPLRADVALVSDGKALAVIVTPERPTRVVAYAAEELARHVGKACGVRLEVVTENIAKEGVRIHLGPCRGSGIEVSKLAPEAFVLRVTESAVFIAGNDGGGDPLDASTSAGTLWGVYEWLDRNLGVRWLWPGELGTHVPKTKTVITKSCNETIGPRFFSAPHPSGTWF